MSDILASLKSLPLFAACAWAAASYPAIPQDRTTPVQQRLAVQGPNGRQIFNLSYVGQVLLTYNELCRLDGIHTKN